MTYNVLINQDGISSCLFISAKNHVEVRKSRPICEKNPTVIFLSFSSPNLTKLFLIYTLTLTHQVILGGIQTSYASSAEKQRNEGIRINS